MKQKPRLLDLRKHVGQVQELRTKLQINKGSILVYTLIIMMIMLATALSIFAVAVREKKGAGTTAASMQAFAVADSGSEIALQAADRGTAINSLPGATSCNSTTGTVTINVAGGIADITFYSDETATTALGCTVSAGSAQKVKSVGRYAGTARAVEVAVAQVSPLGGCQSLELGGVQTIPGTTKHPVLEAVRGCTGNWYLPTSEELSCFIKSSTATDTRLWTRTPYFGGSSSEDYVALNLSTAEWGSESESSHLTRYRCVRYVGSCD